MSVRRSAAGCFHPATEDEVVALVREAHATGKVLRVRGSEHSVEQAILAPHDAEAMHLLLDEMRAVTFDDANFHVTTQAGCNLGHDPSNPKSTPQNGLLHMINAHGRAEGTREAPMNRAIVAFLVFLTSITWSGPARAQNPVVTAITVLSWNVHGIPWPLTQRRQARLERIADRIREEQPDVVALQEVWTTATDSVVHELPDYVAVVERNRHGWASGGLLVLVRASSDWSLNDAVAAQFHPYPDKGPKWKLWQADGISGKGLLVVQLMRRSDGARLWMIDTHLQSQYRCDKYSDVRDAQLRTLSATVDDLAPPLTTVIAGDFNTFPTEAGPYGIIRALGSDLTEAAHAIPGAKTNFATDGTEGWIDYVLVRPPTGSAITGKTRLILNDTSDDPFSDHHGLVVDAVVRP